MESEKKPRISIIAAIGKNRELGKNNELIWRISPDLKRVKELTTGHPIIMGRKTYESIGYPLPNRTNIVITNSCTHIEGCVVHTSLDDAITYAKEIDDEEIFVFGGARIYSAAILFVDRLYLTIIDAEDSDADAFFPAYDMFTTVISEEHHPEHTPPFTWLTLER
jgi:dihydrofolate reductase